MEDFEPIKIVGVIADGVTTPRGDGTAGSALYAVPLRLSRPATNTWARLFEQTWDHPPSYTSSHRPGICRVHGDRIVLDGTTLDEVERTHTATLKTVLDAVNARATAIEREEQRRATERRNKDRAHADDVREKAKRIRFD